MDPFSLKGKTALITGASRGIGQSMAIALAEAGADIVLIKRSQAETTAKKAIIALGRQCHEHICELSSPAAVASLISTLTAAHPTISILINNAGIQRRHAAEEFPDADFAEVIQVNLSTMFTLCRDMGRYWIEKGMTGCKIINLGSLTTFVGGWNMPAYAASKGGVGQLTKALSNEWAAKGICVNAIAPGYIATDINADTRADAESEYNRHINSRIPAGRWGEPDDMKGPAVFLASRASDYVSGHVLTVDGGFMGR